MIPGSVATVVVAAVVVHIPERPRAAFVDTGSAARE
jgi:hypothetical protein